MDAYLKSLESMPSPYLVEGQLSEAARRGKALFHSNRVGCSRCHPPPLFTDCRIHRMGTPPSRYFDNLFDTPTLVEVWRTAPYLHEGQYATVRDLLIDGRHGLRPEFELTEAEIEDLVEYVLSL